MVKPIPSKDYDELVRRINECQVIVNELNESPAWKIFLKDVDVLRQQVDDNWQNIFDEDELRKTRTLKLALGYIVTMKRNYETELEARKKELEQIENVSEEIIKDYDMETNIEN